MTDRRAKRSRRSSTPTTTTGRPATRSPVTATRSSPIAACRSKEIDGVLRYVVDGEADRVAPGPGRRAPAAAAGRVPGLLPGRHEPGGVPGRLHRASRQTTRTGTTATPGSKVMDDQGVEATWLFPSQGVVIEPAAAHRHRGGDRVLPGVQPLARGAVGLRLPGPDLRRAVHHAVRPGREPSTSSSGASTTAPGW